MELKIGVATDSSEWKLKSIH